MGRVMEAGQKVESSVETSLSVSEIRLTLLVLQSLPLILHGVGEVALNHIYKQFMKTAWLFDIHVWVNITSFPSYIPELKYL